MKKILSIIILIVLAITVTSCYKFDEEYKRLSKQYPDAEITKSSDGYFVQLDTDAYNGQDEVSVVGSADAPVFDDLKSVTDDLNLDNHIVFVGKKTDKAKQLIEVDENDYVKDYYTDTIVEVITPLYGDIDAGDEIVYRELYARFCDKDGNERIMANCRPVNNEPILFVACYESLQSELYNGDDVYYSISTTFTPKEISVLKSSSGYPIVHDELYEKYIVNGDLSLDEEVELEKVLQRKKRVMSNKGASEKELAEFKLSDEEVEHVKALVKKYNDLSKTKKVVTEQN